MFPNVVLLLVYFYVNVAVLAFCFSMVRRSYLSENGSNNSIYGYTRLFVVYCNGE